MLGSVVPSFCRGLRLIGELVFYVLEGMLSISVGQLGSFLVYSLCT